jgi:hypothetical protein
MMKAGGFSLTWKAYLQIKVLGRTYDAYFPSNISIDMASVGSIIN